MKRRLSELCSGRKAPGWDLEFARPGYIGRCPRAHSQAKSVSLLPLHHIQRAIHAFFSEVNEQALQLMMHHPECEAEAQRIVRKSNSLLRQHIGTFKSNPWKAPQDSAALKKLCQEAQEDS